MATMADDASRRCLVIAEAGVNHNGSLELARRLVDAAVETGADAVKFQSFRSGELATAAAESAPYQKDRVPAAGGQAELLRSLELAPEDFRALAGYCRERGILFLSTAFDREFLGFLVGELGMPIVKIASGEVTNGPLLLAAARTGREILLSTGMCTLGDIEQALGVLAFGFAGTDAVPGIAAFEGALASRAGREAVHAKVTILHCVTEYPAPLSEANLRALGTLAGAFGTRVGYSDHTAGIAASLAAVALGATVIEKHLTLDRGMSGPDHHASLEPAAFAQLVQGIRDIETAMGSGAKHPSASELANLPIVRRSMVAARDIAKGAVISAEDLAARRPGRGLSPMEFWSLVGARARRAFARDEPIER
jgi:N-acetylneuraminate synthase